MPHARGNVTHRETFNRRLRLLGNRMQVIEVFVDRHVMSKTDKDLCVIGRALRDVPEPHNTALREIINTRWVDGGFTEDEAAFRMKKAGLRSSATSVRQHRRGFCSCP